MNKIYICKMKRELSEIKQIQRNDSNSQIKGAHHSLERQQEQKPVYKVKNEFTNRIDGLSRMMQDRYDSFFPFFETNNICKL